MGMRKAESGWNMTQLELAAEIGSGPMEIVKLYLRGVVSFAELENILGREKACLVYAFASEGGAGKTAGKMGDFLLSRLDGSLRAYMV